MKRVFSFSNLLVPIIIMWIATAAMAQKSGGILRIPLSASPSSGSLHEESAANALRAFMAVYNNLVIFDQQERMTRPETIRPDLATECAWPTPQGLIGGSLMADQLRTIYIEGEVEPKEYTLFTGALIKGACTLAFEMTGAALDDPDVAFYEGYTCASIRNYTKYCNREVEAKIDEQSSTVDPSKRKQLVQALELKLQQDVARLILYQQMHVACRQPYVKGYVKAANGNYTHHRMEDVWLDR